jgi:hypothetical protein
MNVLLFAWWAIVGWCGTVPRPPIPLPPPPDPDPDPWYRVIGAVGGILGGWAFSQVFPAGDASLAVLAATTGIGALIGSALVADIYGMVRGSQRAQGVARKSI